MSRMLSVHIGGIDLGRDRLFDVVKTKRSDVLYELNNWLFDYRYANQLPIIQLPALDDWTHSHEDGSYWSIAFPDSEWNIWMRSELLEFQ